MYEKSVAGDLGGDEHHSPFRLFANFASFRLGSCFACRLIFLLRRLVQPVVDGYGAFCVFLYLIGQAQSRHLSLLQYIVEGTWANFQLLCNTALLLVIAHYPGCKLIHRIPIVDFFFWTNIRYSDTIVSISGKGMKNNRFLIT